MFTTHRNLLDTGFCNYLIEFLNKQKTPVEWDDGVILTRLYDHIQDHEGIKMLHQQMTIFGVENFGSAYYVQSMEVVKRTDVGMIMHKDTIEHDHALVCFLNDNYDGGRAIVEEDYINPEIGKAVVVQGNRVKHGVTPTRGSRYVFLCWWSRK